MDLKFGDIQETALIPLAIKASETSRPNARIRDLKAKEIIDSLGVDVSKYDPFMSHEGVVARTIMYRDQLKALLRQYPDAVCINLGCGFDDKFSQVDNGKLQWFDVDHGFLLAELHCPFMEKNSKHHDAVKYTKASFGWGTKSGKEYLELEPRMTLVSERSYNEEMKKYSIRGKLFAIIGKNINNRLAVYKW